MEGEGEGARFPGCEDPPQKTLNPQTLNLQPETYGFSGCLELCSEGGQTAVPRAQGSRSPAPTAMAINIGASIITYTIFGGFLIII